ncbi:hypothetical protein DITRI_Ditri04bG0138500 [Diplodiscus trichospermus]
MATLQCERPVEETLHEKSHEKQLSAGQTQVHKEMVHAETKSSSQSHGHNQGQPHDMTKTHAESKTLSQGAHVQHHAAAQGMDMTCHGKKDKKIKEKKKKEKKEKKEKKTENKKKPEKEKSKHKKCKDSSSDSD